jgi:hypothetical protein
MTAVTFDYSAYIPTEETLREYVFGDLPGSPSVWMAPAVDSNKDFLNERMRLNIEASERIAKEARGTKAGPMTPEQMAASIETDREVDRKLLSRACAKKWGTVPKDIHGNSPEFNEANCYAFFSAVPAWMFDPLRNFAANIYNFVDTAVVTDADAAALGNS